MARPSSYTQEVADEICERIACSESLKSIVREEGKPSEMTVMRWLRANDAFREQYARARADQADSDADLVTDIGIRVQRGELDAAAARVAMDCAKWSAGKRNAKKYGDKVDLNHGGQAGNPIMMLLAEVDGSTFAPKREDDDD